MYHTIFNFVSLGGHELPSRGSFPLGHVNIDCRDGANIEHDPVTSPLVRRRHRVADEEDQRAAG